MSRRHDIPTRRRECVWAGFVDQKNLGGEGTNWATSHGLRYRPQAIVSGGDDSTISPASQFIVDFLSELSS